jgi:ligand-binding sensor domain-containing protein
MKKDSSRRRVKLFLFVICSFLLNSLLFLQTDRTKFERLGIDAGLSNQKVNDIIQDKNGFLWFATDNEKE